MLRGHPILEIPMKPLLAAATVAATCLLQAIDLAGQTIDLPTSAYSRASGFAASVAIAGDEVLIARTGAEIRMATYPQPGGLYRYRRDPSGAWILTGELAPASGAVGDQFGVAVAADGGSLVVGAPGANGTGGRAHVFARADEGWVETAILDPAAVANAGAGSAVGLAGGVAFVGAPGGLNDLAALGQPAPPQPGVVYIFERGADGVWTLGQSLSSPGGDGGDRFGSSLLVVGNDLFVGAPRREGQGAVYHFRRADGRWSLTTTLTLEGATPGAGFGSSIIRHGDLVLIAAPGHGATGGVAVFENRDGWVHARTLTPEDAPGRVTFGAAAASDGDMVLVGAPAASSAAGVIYVYRGSDLRHVETLGGHDFGPGASFGTSVAVDGPMAVVGAGQADLRLGAAAVLERTSDDRWRFSATLHDPIRNTVAAITGGDVACEDGVAGDYSCTDVDLVSFIPLQELGAGPASIANDIWGWTDSATGREYVLLGKSNGTSFVDITDPSNPVYLGELPLHEGAQENLWRDVKTYADHAFIVADGAGAHGVQVFDLTRLRDVTNAPETFDEDAHYDRVFSSHNIVINEETGFAYAVGNSGGGPCGGGLHMIDVRDPKSPVFAGCYNDPGIGGFLGAGYTHDAQCVLYDGPDEDFAGREICFHASISALAISDITDKENPIAVANADYPGVVAAHQGWLTEDKRYFFMGDELDEESGTVGNTRTLVWDVAELDDPVLVKEYFASTKAIDHNQYIRGDYLYQSNLMSGLRILDISDPENPVEVAFFDTVPQDDDATAFGGSWSNYPFFPSGVIAVSSWNEGLFILKKRERTLVP
jgi:choice-of-anchor B domain-containing protein